MYFGDVRQIGYVVTDIDETMDIWIKTFSVGPWFIRRNLVATEFRYYGKEAALPSVDLAIAYAGNMQIELVQPNDDTPSLYNDTLAKNGEIAQHIAYWTSTEFDAWCADVERHGFVEGHAGRFGAGRGRFAYFVHPRFPSIMVELSESTGGKIDYFEKVKHASINWDGNRPIRMPADIA